MRTGNNGDDRCAGLHKDPHFPSYHSGTGAGTDTTAGMDALRGGTAERDRGAHSGGLHFHQHTHHVHANIQWLPRQLSSLPGSQRLFWRWLESSSVSSYLCLYALEQEINPKIVQKLLGHRDVSTTLGIYTHVVPEVFAGVAAAVDTASQQLMDGTYTPKRSAEAVRAQLQQIDPMLSEDMTVNLKYL